MICINDLCFSYRGNDYVLDKLNLKIEKGSYVSIIGKNGSAKSTLIKLILGLLKPNSGEIHLKTHNIGYVPQRMENFNSTFPITVEEVLTCYSKVLKIRNKNEVKRVLKIVNMVEFKNRLIGNLSGGQLQKIFIARALIGNPEVIILDEPSTGVDMKSQEELYYTLKSLNRQGITIISVEHNLNAALANSTHICKLSNYKCYMYTIDEYKSYLTNSTSMNEAYMN